MNRSYPWSSIIGLMLCCLTGNVPFVSATQVGLYDVFERAVANSKSYSNPFDFNIIELQASFRSPSGKTVRFFGFYDGNGNGRQAGNVWKLRFMPDELGRWKYTYRWTDGTPGGSGSFTVIETGLPGPLKIAADNSWFFMNSRNQPFHFRGYDFHNFLYWTDTVQMTQEIGQFKSALQDRIDKGYNFYMWDMMADRLNNSSKHYAWDAGDSGWLNTTDTKRFDIPVWRAYEDALRLAKDKRVYVMPFTGMIFQGAEYNLADFKVFLRYFVARFAAFYNFLGWSPTWEATDIWTAAETNQIMQYVYDMDPWKRLLTVHDCSNSRYKGWLSFSMRQRPSRSLFTGNSRRAGASQGDCDGIGGIGDAFVDLPVIGSEDLWETRPEQARIYDPTGWIMPRNANEARRAAWGIMMAGVMPLYSDWHAWAPLGGGKGQGEAEVRRMFDFFYSKTRYRQYRQLNDLVLSSSGQLLLKLSKKINARRLNRMLSSSAGQIASGIPGQEYLVYDQHGESITIDLADASSSTSFSVLWYDPKTGAEQSRGRINGGATRTLHSTFAGDAVLLLRR
jgi:hypothetical protein